VKERLVAYSVFAEKLQVDCILNACSSVGDIVASMREQVKVPVVRIDEAMAEKAVRMGKRIGVTATLNTTLQPTLRLLKSKADESGVEVEFVPVLAEEAYKRLIAGDKDGHDEVLAEVLAQLIEQVDVVVLAQASMARVVRRLPEAVQDRFLTSPSLGMERVSEVLKGGA
jgi:Asp/Glu/hydantoin racemase